MRSGVERGRRMLVVGVEWLEGWSGDKEVRRGEESGRGGAMAGEARGEMG